MSRFLVYDHTNDGINRRGFLECMAWAGSGVLWTVSGGVLSSQAFGKAAATTSKGELNFVQISDSHIGFNKPANPDVSGTLQATVDKINALPHAPEFIIHTGDISHTAKASEFDNLEGILKGANQKQVFYVPGEHDIAVDDAKQYASARDRAAAAGTASIKKASTSSAWSMSEPWKAWASWAPINWNGWKMICEENPPALPSCCSRIFRCGPYIRNGAGARRIASKLSAM